MRLVEAQRGEDHRFTITLAEGEEVDKVLFKVLNWQAESEVQNILSLSLSLSLSLTIPSLGPAIKNGCKLFNSSYFRIFLNLFNFIIIIIIFVIRSLG